MCEKQPTLPNVPANLLLYFDMIDWAQSSITASLYFLAILQILSIEHTLPVKWTGIIAFVLLVIFDSIRFSSIF